MFVDRDGVLTELVDDPVSGLPESPLEPDRVTLVPGAAHALVELRAAGYALVGVSNQPAAAKGVVTVDRLEAVQARALELLERAGASFDTFRLCLHHPDGTVAELTGDCTCRKPAPGMLLEAAGALRLDLAASWMVGDTDVDVAAGAAAGCRTILVENAGSAHKRSGRARPDGFAPDLTAAASLILRRDTSC